MMLRTKSEQKAYLAGYEMCAECIKEYLSDEGKKKLECLIVAVRNAVEIEDTESESESAYKEMCENGVDNVDYDIRQMMKDAVVIKKSLCDSCVTKGCIFQSGIVRNHCDFYKSESEDKE